MQTWGRAGLEELAVGRHWGSAGLEEPALGQQCRGSAGRPGRAGAGQQHRESSATQRRLFTAAQQGKKRDHRMEKTRGQEAWGNVPVPLIVLFR